MPASTKFTNSRKAILGIATAALALALSMGAAEAKYNHHHHFHGGGVILSFSDGPYYGNGPSCYWLKRRAIETGSRYWWRRYSFCRGF